MTELRTPNLLLRPWAEADAEALHAAYGDAETMRFWDSPRRESVTETAGMIRGSRAADPRYHAAFAIVPRRGGPAVGAVNYHDRLSFARRLAVGWILAEAWRRRGIMREAVPALLDHCFDDLGAHRIEARIEPGNLASARLAEALGFQREGLMRDWTFVDGEPRSCYMHALLRPDWRDRRAQVSRTSSP